LLFINANSQPINRFRQHHRKIKSTYSLERLSPALDSRSSFAKFRREKVAAWQKRWDNISPGEFCLEFSDGFEHFQSVSVSNNPVPDSPCRFPCASILSRRRRDYFNQTVQIGFARLFDRRDNSAAVFGFPGGAFDFQFKFVEPISGAMCDVRVNERRAVKTFRWRQSRFRFVV